MSAFNRNLCDLYASCTHDPYRFALLNFPWGEPNSFLSGYGQPQAWQREVMDEIKSSLQANPFNPIRIAVSAGHGVGKSALFSMLALWALSTKPHTRVVATANTANQLKSKTMAELSRWRSIALNADWWEMSQYKMSYVLEPGFESSWQLEGVAWSISSPESFAGLHNKGNRILIVVDEASAIPESIYEVVEGAMTDEGTEIIQVLLGNPTRSSGKFYNAFHRDRNQYKRFVVSSESVEITNKRQLKEWEDVYGRDSDFFRVRCLGQFPNQAESQFIPRDSVENAMLKDYKYNSFLSAPKIMGIDIARFGGDSTSMWIKQGLYADRLCVMNKADTIAVAERIASLINEHKPDAINIDEGNTGAAVVDLLRSWGVRNVRGVAFAGRADKDDVYLNKRVEMWGRLKDWLKEGGMLPRAGSPAGKDIEPELTSVEYFYNSKGLIQLERKEDMKKRGLPSPDNADALALCFAFNIKAKNTPVFLQQQRVARTSLDWKL